MRIALLYTKNTLTTGALTSKTLQTSQLGISFNLEVQSLQPKTLVVQCVKTLGGPGALMFPCKCAAQFYYYQQLRFHVIISAWFRCVISKHV